MLRAFSPKLSRVAVLLNPGNPASVLVLKHVTTAASTLGVEIEAASAATPQAIETAVADAAQHGAWRRHRRRRCVPLQGSQIAASALQHRLATLSFYRDHVVAGCLLSYGQNVAEFHRRAATYIDKILNGAKPENLPVEQPTKFDLLINSRTAAMLGLAIPRELIVLADEVIE